MAFLLLISSISAQEKVQAPSRVVQAALFDVTPPLVDMPFIEPGSVNHKPLQLERNPELKARYYPYAESALPKGPDAVWQKTQGQLLNTKAPSQNFDGIANLFGGAPPDTDGDVSPNHYFQMINLSFEIF